MLCIILCYFNYGISSGKENGDYVANVFNEKETLHESGEGLKLESEDVVIEEATEEDVVTTQSYTAEITCLTWVMRDTYIDGGVEYYVEKIFMCFVCWGISIY